MSRFALRTAVASFALATLATSALAQPTITWYKVAGGGGMNSTNGSLSLSGTIGQHDASPTPLTNGSLSLTGGFWVAAATTGPCPCVADFDQSGGTPDASDIDAFFVSWLAGQPESDADCSGGTPDASDIDAFFVQWLAGGC